MIIEVFILSVLVGMLRKGSFRALGRIPLRCAYLFAVPVMLFPLIYILALALQHPIPMPYIRLMNVAVYAFLVAAIALNLHIRQMWPILVGTASNALVLAVNGGVMPVSRGALAYVHMSGALGSNPVRHSLMTPDTLLKPLADIIPVPALTLFGRHILAPEVASVGDALVSVGLFLLVQRFMCGPRVQTEEKPKDE